MRYSFKREIALTSAILISGILLCSPLAAQGSPSNPGMRSSLDAVQLGNLPFATGIWKKMYFGTNRLIDHDAVRHARIAAGKVVAPSNVFQNMPDVSVTYGFIEVSSPANRLIGDQTFSTWDAYFFSSADALRDTVKDAGFSERTPTLLFVPGFRNSLYDGAKRLMQLSLDLEHSGMPFLFSWPSDTDWSSIPTPSSYRKANSFAVISARYLAQTIKELMLPNEFEVIAHSLGTKVFANSMLSRLPSGYPYFPSQSNYTAPSVVFAAPDIGQNEFSDMRVNLLTKVQHISVYCSHDAALAWAKKILGPDERLGFCEKLRDPANDDEGTTFIRVYGAVRDFANHSYYANSPEVLTDIKQSLFEVEHTFGIQRVFVAKKDREIFLVQ